MQQHDLVHLYIEHSEIHFIPPYFEGHACMNTMHVSHGAVFMDCRRNEVGNDTRGEFVAGDSAGFRFSSPRHPG